MGKFYDLLRSGKKPIVGMVHLAALPGSVHFAEALEKTTARALKEMKTLSESGFDAVLMQNTGDVPATEDGDEATVACMTSIGMQLREISDAVFGVNVLMNGSKAALAIAKAVNADFVRIKINCGVVSTSTGMVAADPHAVLAFRKRIGGEQIDIIGDLYDRTAAPVGTFPLEVLGDLAIRHADVRALVVSGYDYQDLVNRLILLRDKLPDALLIVGGGAKVDNLAELINLSDAVIVGSSIKSGGGFLDPIDAEKAKAFMDAANTFR